MTLFIFFTSICCFFLLLFSVHLFFAKRGIRLSNHLLSILFFSGFGQLLISLMVHSDPELYPAIYRIFMPLAYATPACFYLYVTGFVHSRSHLLKFQWIHFIPAILAIVHILPWHLVPEINWKEISEDISENKQLYITKKTGLFPAAFYYLGLPALLLGYLLAAWRVVLKSKFLNKAKASDTRNWLFFFLKTSTFFQLTGFIPLIFWNIENPVIHNVFLMLNCLILLVVIIFLLHHPKLFYGYLFTSVSLDTESDQNEAEPIIVAPTSPVKTISLLPEQLLTYSNSMSTLMETQKPYLLPDFQIADLARELHIPVHHCSFIINNLIGKNFRDWINEHRINLFIEQYPLKAEKMTIESVARECGFKNTATFYNAFKKEKGSMPKTYFSPKSLYPDQFFLQRLNS